jgi:hypothetical protein
MEKVEGWPIAAAPQIPVNLGLANAKCNIFSSIFLKYASHANH